MMKLTYVEILAKQFIELNTANSKSHICINQITELANFDELTNVAILSGPSGITDTCVTSGNILTSYAVRTRIL